MYLKFGQVSIWPNREVIRATMPDSFQEKYSCTPVIIDCTEIRCQMPSSLLLNSKLFSSYKNHVTLKGLVFFFFFFFLIIVVRGKFSCLIILRM